MLSSTPPPTLIMFHVYACWLVAWGGSLGCYPDATYHTVSYSINFGNNFVNTECMQPTNMRLWQRASVNLKRRMTPSGKTCNQQKVNCSHTVIASCSVHSTSPDQDRAQKDVLPADAQALATDQKLQLLDKYRTAKNDLFMKSFNQSCGG